MYNLYNTKTIVCDGYGNLALCLNPEGIKDYNRHGEVGEIKIKLDSSLRLSHIIELDTISNDQCSLYISKIENIVPNTPQEENVLKDTHRILCNRLNWTPKQLSH